MRLHHIPGARSCRVIWLLEELGGIDYTLETYRLGDPRLRAPAYRALNPAGKVPTLEDEGIVFHESGAIVQYLLERHGGGRLEPAIGSPARGPYLQWLHWSEATLLAPLGQINAHKFVLREADRSASALALARRQFARVLGQLEAVLADRDYLVEGRFTAADLMAGYGVALARMVGELGAQVELGGHGELGAQSERGGYGEVGEAGGGIGRWFARLEARPAFVRAFAGGFAGID